MILKFRNFIIFLLLVFFVIGTLSAQAESDLETIIQGADLSDMMAVSGNGTLIFEYTRVDSLSSRAQEDDQAIIAGLSPEEKAVLHNHEKIEITFAFDDPKMRFDENSLNRLPTGRLYIQNWQWAYNGEKMDLLRLDGLGEKGLIKPMGSIRTENVIPVHRFDPRYNGVKILGTPVGTFLRGSLGDKTIGDSQIIGEEMQDDIICNVIRGQIMETSDTITVWLAPGLMYRPKHVEIHSSETITIIHNTFRKHTGGIWFPEQILKEIYYFDENTGEEVLSERETLTVQNDFELNIKLPDNLFEIVFPVGLMVYDYRTGGGFEVK